MNLRYKLFSGFVLLIIIPLFFFATTTFLITFHLLEKKYSEQAEFSMRAIGQSLTYIFDEINIVTDSGIANDVFKQALSSPDPSSQELISSNNASSDKEAGSEQGEGNGKVDESKAGEGDEGIDYIRQIERQQNFRKLLFNHPTISYAFLYNLRGFSDSEIVRIFTKEGFNEMPLSQFKEHPVYKEVMELKGQPLWIGPNEYPEITGTEPVFTQIRTVKNLTTLKNIGISVVQMKTWELDTFFNKFYTANENENTRFFIVNDQGFIIYDNKKSHTGQTLQDMMTKPLKLTKGYYSYKDKFNVDQSIVSTYEMPNYNWHLVSIRDWNSLSNEMVDYIRWVSIVIAVCILGAFMFNMLFMNRITNSIGRIVRFMRKVEDGDLHTRVIVEGTDELATLSKGYNRLMDRVNDLIDQVKQEQKQKTAAEMRVLQAQIKPHFLFNTLESINVLAIQNQGRKVSQMVYRLGNILRISIQDKEEITIRQELEYLRSYLEIQKFRFDEVFNFEIDVPDDLMQYMIQKLTLQPLVENCIQHAFDGTTEMGWIRISAHSDAERIYLIVEDNGVGMSNEQLQRFVYMETDESNNLVPQLQETMNVERRGLGVRSVADRIRIQHGPRYGLYVCSASGKGTIIQCTIPKYEQGENL
ncbi:sensor histidine kinase [Paenibacillus sp. 1001270B_150601_E10]|uniref:sensor histidine kinase n=1 Tax=Paenibacillus sp. 1001270B_150601_E10 TaxID=2787079 RepID=UPI00189FA44C|nr:sensor histidine kinase [Paenibacillus sp. 1001270B_150601_E10]